MFDNSFESALSVDTACKLLETSIKELEKQNEHIQLEVSNHLYIQEKFKISPKTCLDLDDELFAVNNDVDNTSVAVSLQNQKIDDICSRLKATQLSNNLNRFKNYNASRVQYNEKKTIELYNYRNECRKRLEDLDLDEPQKLSFALDKLQEKIREKYEKTNMENKATIDKFSECMDLYHKITDFKKQKEALKSELKKYYLPPNIPEAEKMLAELQKKYQELSTTFSRGV